MRVPRAWKWRSLVLAGLFSMGGLLALPAGAFSRGELLTVVQRETAIRKEKRLLSARVAPLKEGDQVVKLDTEGSWHRVEHQGQEGWLPVSSVSSDRKVVLSGQAVAGGIRATEQSAGARGFNPEVEARHRASRMDLAEAYRLVDRIQEQKFSEETIARFIREGKLGDPSATVVETGSAAGAAPTPTASRGAASRGAASREKPAALRESTVPPWKR